MIGRESPLCASLILSVDLDRVRRPIERQERPPDDQVRSFAVNPRDQVLFLRLRLNGHPENHRSGTATSRLNCGPLVGVSLQLAAERP